MNQPFLRHDLTPSLRHHWHFSADSSPVARRPTDRFYKWLYILLSIVVLAGGLHNGYEANWRIVDWVGEAWNPQACSVSSPLTHQLSSYQMLSYWGMGSIVASFFFGTILIYVFKVHAFGVTIAAVVAQILAPLCCGVYLYVSDAQHEKSQRAVASVLISVGVLLAVLHSCARRKLIVVAKMFQVAAFGLEANGGLISWILGLWLSWMLLLLACMAFTGFTLASGTLVPNPVVIAHHKHACIMPGGTRTFCCTYELQDWKPAYLAALWLYFAWSSMIIFQLRLFVIAGVISQWYFAPYRGEDGSSVWKHVQQALGPQFGTIALGALILWLVQLLRWPLKLVPLNPRNCICRIVFCPCSLVARFILSAVECVSTFATIMASMMGTGFLEGGRQAVELLRRNLLRTVYVWWLPSFVMNAAMLMLGLAWGVVVYYLAVMLHWTLDQDQAAVLALVCGLISTVVLYLVGSVLLNIVDVVYVCYALDRERFMQTRQDVHILFHELPVHTSNMIAEIFDPGYSAPGVYVPPPPPMDPDWSSYGYQTGVVHAPPIWSPRLPPPAEHFAPPPLFQQWG